VTIKSGCKAICNGFSCYLSLEFWKKYYFYTEWCSLYSSWCLCSTFTVSIKLLQQRTVGNGLGSCSSGWTITLNICFNRFW